jgi:hypothetical protein
MNSIPNNTHTIIYANHRAIDIDVFDNYTEVINQLTMNNLIKAQLYKKIKLQRYFNITTEPSLVNVIKPINNKD